MFCAHCGSANADEAKFCVKCGAALQATTTAAVSGPMAPGVAPGASSAVPTAPVLGPSGWPAPPAGTSSYAVPAQPYTGPTEMSGKALASLICGIFFFVFPSAIAAIILGHISLSDIRKAAGRLTGHGMGLAGLVLGYLGIAAIPFILIVAAIAIPNLLRARMAANEASAVESLRVINTTTVTYYSAYGNGYAPSLEILGGFAGETSADCNHALLIDSTLTSGERNGYRFIYTLEPPSDGSENLLSKDAVVKGCKTPGSSAGYSVVAEPIAQGTTGERSFYTDATGTIRYSTEGRATVDSTPLQ
jgi:type IV pilus assembly protein PilA